MSLKYVLLTLLDREPGTGYDIVRAFDDAIGYFWNASHQQVYRELGSLSDSKLVKFKQIKQDDKPDKKLYSISNSGKKALQQWLESPVKAQKSKNLLLVKLLNTNSNNAAIMLDELERNISESELLQATYQELEKRYYSPQQVRSLPDDEIMIYAALRRGILSIDAQLVWLAEVKALLQNSFSE